MTLRVLFSLPIVASAFLVSACATPEGEMMAAGDQRHMDKNQMCAMYRQMTAGKSEAEQQAAAEAHIKAMHGSADPQMVAMHRQMMERSCSEKGRSPGAAPDSY